MQHLSDFGSAFYDLIINFGVVLIILIDKLSSKQIYIKLFKIAGAIAIVRKKYLKIMESNIDLTTMLSASDYVVKFFNGVDKVDDRQIRSFSKSLKLILEKSYVSSLILDFTLADEPHDFRKIEYLIRLVCNGPITKQIKVYIPQYWKLVVPKYTNIKVVMIDRSAEESFIKGKHRRSS